jgi:hypothetical protein
MPIDSLSILNHNLDSLNRRLDYLSQQINDATIKTGFFDNIMSIQTAIFVVIIGLLALISWTFVFKWIKNSHTAIIKRVVSHQHEADSKILKIETDNSRDFKTLVYTLRSAEIQIAKSMYLGCHTMKYRVSALLWCVRVSGLIVKQIEEEQRGRPDDIKIFGVTIDQAADIIINENWELEPSDREEIEVTCKEIIEFEKGKYKEQYEKILFKINQHFYTYKPKKEDFVITP